MQLGRQAGDMIALDRLAVEAGLHLRRPAADAFGSAPGYRRKGVPKKNGTLSIDAASRRLGIL
jgi:hypothetical protein